MRRIHTGKRINLHVELYAVKIFAAFVIRVEHKHGVDPLQLLFE